MKHIMVICVIVGTLGTLVSGVADGTLKPRLEKCKNTSDPRNLNCTTKIVLDLVLNGSRGEEALIVEKITELEVNSSGNMQTLRDPLTITVNKSAIYALYDLKYIEDVPYKPQEYNVTTRECAPDAGPDILQICERLRDEKGDVLNYTEPVCCPCGPQQRTPLTCGEGKANTTHCLRFPGEWYHVFAIGERSVGFSVRVELKIGTKVYEVIIGPKKTSANDNFLKVKLTGHIARYKNLPRFVNFYLVTPREATTPHGPPLNLGENYSMWMTLEQVKFGSECDTIGVSYKAFQTQPNFCSSPYWSCLHNQLWNYHEEDMNLRRQSLAPLYGLEGRYERINQHPNAGPQAFSIGVTETFDTDLRIELIADDIENVSSIGNTCRLNCSSFFDFRCHLQEVCLSWLVKFGLLLALLLAACVFITRLLRKNHFDSDHHRPNRGGNLHHPHHRHPRHHQHPHHSHQLHRGHKENKQKQQRRGNHDNH